MSLETFGPYQLIKRLATGGMAQIYLARQLGLEGFEKLLVVKRILPHLAENEDFVRMFLDEARIAARLNHPNIVQIFNLGSEDETYFIAMEYIHGEDVRRVWRRAEGEGKSMPMPLVCRIMMDACNGLDYAHKKTDQSGRPLGIVHRDISPQNIIVTFEGGVKIVDFGIAKAADQATVTRSGVLKGKYSYMSPEQAAGKRVDSRSDIFALGIVLYELLTGTRLFKRSNDIQTLNAVTACEVTLPSEVNPSLPPGLDPIIMRALSKDPADRFQEAVHLQLALEDFLLQHRMPSSSAHLAAFMNEIYSDRLERERREGRVLVDDVDSGLGASQELPRRAKTPIPPAPPPYSQSGSNDRETRAARNRTHSTEAERRSHSVVPSVPSATEAASVTGHGAPRALTPGLAEAARGVRQRVLPLMLWAVLGLVVVGSVAVLRFWPVTPRPTVRLAEVTVTSNPPGASVLFNGNVKLEQVTPVRLPSMPAGKYSVRLSLAGYEDLDTRVTIPPGGEHTLKPVALAKARGPAVKQPEPRTSTTTLVSTHTDPVAEKSIPLAVLSDPPGAQVLSNGEGKGRTPVTFEQPLHAQVKLKLEKAGYASMTRQFRLDEETAEQSFTLERVAPRTAGVSSGGTGKISFVLKPLDAWADVTCGGRKIGQAPMAAQSFPVGTYDCTFENPDLGMRTAHFDVKAGPNKPVFVQF